MKPRLLMHKEYRGATRVAGPLLFVDKAPDLPYGAMVNITSGDGPSRSGQVIEVSEENAVIQVLEQTMGLDVVSATVSLVDSETRLGVSEDMIGRSFNGSGKAIDGLSEVIPDALLSVAGMPMNPISREQPSDFIQTGISSIDGFNTLVRGQKLPIFSGSGLPANEIAAQILRSP